MNKYSIVFALAFAILGCKSTSRIVVTKKQQQTTSSNTKEKDHSKNTVETKTPKAPSETTNTTVANLETTLIKPTVNKVPANITNNVARYIYKYKSIACYEMQQHGVPASITLAQGILESGSGLGQLAAKSNNHFGIKCHTWDGERVYHDDDKKGECFRKYDNPADSFKDHSLFLSKRNRYAFLFNYNKTDYISWAKGLKKAGYATDPKYPSKLIDLIERYDLNQFDFLSIQNTTQTTPHLEVTPNAKPEVTESETIIESQPKQNVENIDVTNKEVEVEIVETPQENNPKTYTVREGDTLYAISKKLSIEVSRIKELNNLSDNNINIGQQLIIE